MSVVRQSTEQIQCNDTFISSFSTFITSDPTELHNEHQIQQVLRQLGVYHGTSYSYQLARGRDLGQLFPEIRRSVWHPDNTETLRPIYQGWFIR